MVSVCFEMRLICHYFACTALLARTLEFGFPGMLAEADVGFQTLARSRGLRQQSLGNGILCALPSPHQDVGDGRTGVEASRPGMYWTQADSAVGWIAS